MADQIEGMIRDSDVKFQCRLLLAIIQSFDLPKGQLTLLLEPIHQIVVLENERLNKLKENT